MGELPPKIKGCALLVARILVDESVVDEGGASSSTTPADPEGPTLEELIHNLHRINGTSLALLLNRLAPCLVAPTEKNLQVALLAEVLNPTDDTTDEEEDEEEEEDGDAEDETTAGGDEDDVAEDEN